MPSSERQPGHERPAAYDEPRRRQLLALAAESIRRGLAPPAPWEPDPALYPTDLSQPRASFVTLEIGAALRGCIGTLEAHRPLLLDVAHNAYAAAFQDPRFAPLRPDEYPRLSLHVSILSLPEPVAFGSESELIAKLRPGIDGLILREGRHRGTFLPSVWEQLPDPEDFLKHLKRKAGLPASHWSAQIEIQRYTTESFGGPVQP
jgi:uncharacterized protein